MNDYSMDTEYEYQMYMSTRGLEIVLPTKGAFPHLSSCGWNGVATMTIFPFCTRNDVCERVANLLANSNAISVINIISTND